MVTNITVFINGALQGNANVTRFFPVRDLPPWLFGRRSPSSIMSDYEHNQRHDDQ